MGCKSSSFRNTKRDSSVTTEKTCDTVVVQMSRPYAKYLTHIWKIDGEPTVREVRIHYYNLAADDPTRPFVEGLVRTLSNNGLLHNTGSAQYIGKIPAVMIPLFKSKCMEKHLEMKWIHFDRD